MMKLRNFNKFLIGLVVISGGLTGTVLSNSNIHSGLAVKNQTTSDISWNITEDGLISPADKSKVSGAIEIPSVWDGKPVTGIANSAFEKCKSLKTIDIPSGVTSSGVYAFRHCSSLVSVTFAEGSQLTSIAIGAFFDCSSLKTINIPNSVTSIGYNAFWDCSSLTSINIPNSVTFISSYTFKGCSSLISINIPSSVTSIGDGAFNWCSSLASINIPNSVTRIGTNAFRDCSSLKEINISENNFYQKIPTMEDGKEIGAYVIAKGQDLSTSAIAGCLAYGKINIELPSGKSSITDNAFMGSNITEVSFSKNIISIGHNVFSNCMFLTTINIPDTILNIGASAFTVDPNLKSIYLNWTGAALDDIIYKINNPEQVVIPNWACIFADLSNDNSIGTHLINKENANVYLPSGIDQATIQKYKDNFVGLKEDKRRQLLIGVGLDPATTHWIYNSNSNSKLPLILGLTFGFIILIGIGSYLGYRYYKHCKNSKK